MSTKQYGVSADFTPEGTYVTLYDGFTTNPIARVPVDMVKGAPRLHEAVHELLWCLSRDLKDHAYPVDTYNKIQKTREAYFDCIKEQDV